MLYACIALILSCGGGGDASVSQMTDTVPLSVATFTIPVAANSLTVPITSFTATGAVAGYFVAESPVAPSSTADGWSPTAQTSFNFVTAGNKTLHAWVKDAAGNVSTGKTASVQIDLPSGQSSGTPILIISSEGNAFTRFYAEILRAEGINSFDRNDISSVSSTMLAAHDVVLLGEMPLTVSQVTMLSNWVSAGGKLIAMRPDGKLAGLLGLAGSSSTLSDRYLLVKTSSGPGAGIVNQTMQYHGAADLYTLNGASMLATLYSTATTATSNPAVTLISVGSNGGQAAAFTYDLARSVVYTRQGNPAWSGQERDGQTPIRPDDLFFGNSSVDPKPDWVDLNKVAIPQADEQQRLLANLIIRMNFDRKPVPRFWYFPRSVRAVIVMTGDDHGSFYSGGATAPRFDQYLAASPKGCVVDNWECIRSTSYLFPPLLARNPLTDSQAAAYVNAGFEVSVHTDSNPDCANWTPASLDSAYTNDLSSFASAYASVPAPSTHRMHCISWSDYDSQPKTELRHGIRLDTSYLLLARQLDQ